MCLDCFSRSFERRFEGTLKKERVLRPVGRVLVALSGSVSSLVLSLLLERVERGFPYIKLFFVHLRRWGDRAEEENVVSFIRKHLASELEIFQIESLLEIPSFEKLVGDAFVSCELSCIVCKSLIRRALFRAAKKLDTQYIVLGETLDEYLTDKVIKLWSLGRSESLDMVFVERPPKGIRISRPLLFATTEEVEHYSEVKGLSKSKFVCPYRDRGRHRVLRALNTIEEGSPGMLFSFRRALNAYDDKI
ncbi:MAG: hypothetical protein QW201_02020 [Thermoproteota archaeon]